MRSSGGGKWLDRLQFTLLFLVLTVLVHQGFGLLQGWVKLYDPYKVPEGSATKVFQADGENGAAVDWAERLKLFLVLGE